ncbi:MAG: SpoIIIAH-like family protein [Clostridiales bacterium]|nr:SpoIIIAH-like family protein [Clostridiales bacterium]
MSKKKKIIVLTSMVALLAVTAVFNFMFTTKSLGSTEMPVTANSYFAEMRAERVSARSENLTQLDTIINGTEVSATERSEALKLKMQLTEMTEQEMLLETLIKAYGFEDCVVTMGINSSNVNVMVKTTDLTQEDAILIYSIIEEEHISTFENVNIIPIS